ncbi:MAG: hypothetical protein MK098_05205 [Marinovum sp.]|nr:hypothetical protein [Marinovum sp.]
MLSNSVQMLPDLYALFERADTGHGIPSDPMTKRPGFVFTTKAPWKGTGLYLYRVLGFAVAMGFGLEMKSGPVGTAVSLYPPPILASAKAC